MFSSQKLLVSKKVAKPEKTLTQKYFSHLLHLVHECRVRHVPDRAFSIKIFTHFFHPSVRLLQLALNPYVEGVE